MFIWTHNGEEVAPISGSEGKIYLLDLPHWIAHLLELGQIIFLGD